MRDWIRRGALMVAIASAVAPMPATAQEATAPDTTLPARVRRSEQRLEALRYRFTDAAPEVQTVAAEVRRLRAELPPEPQPTGKSLMGDSTYAAQAGYLHGLRYRRTEGDPVVVAAVQRLAALRDRLCAARHEREGCPETHPRVGAGSQRPGA